MINLEGKTICITGSARRIGREFAIAAAKAGASIILHYGHSEEAARKTAESIRETGAPLEIIQADFSNPEQSVTILESVFEKSENLFALVNNASIFEPLNFTNTKLADWQTHFDVNLTVPFLLSQAFQRSLGKRQGKIINILDWRALRPGKDHLPYTISKAGLAALTRAMAVSLAPQIAVNGIALGAILPPADGNEGSSPIIDQIPMNRWAKKGELTDLFLFLLSAPDYLTGEILHLDGGRHLV